MSYVCLCKGITDQEIVCHIRNGCTKIKQIYKICGAGTQCGSCIYKIKEIMENETMRTAVYAGSFDPWHQGHRDILQKTLKCFDRVVVGIGINPEKEVRNLDKAQSLINEDCQKNNISGVEVKFFTGMLVDFAKQENAVALIRGLRNGHDLQYEMNQQYWLEDLGIDVPVVYFICDRALSHISSSMVKMVKKLKGK